MYGYSKVKAHFGLPSHYIVGINYTDHLKLIGVLKERIANLIDQGSVSMQCYIVYCCACERICCRNLTTV